MTRTPNKLYIRQFGAMMIINDQHAATMHRLIGSRAEVDEDAMSSEG
jgi:hypothetical protein